MRFIPFFLIILFVVGCSSGRVTAPIDDDTSRVGLSESYGENGNLFVDVTIDGATSLYQFSMRLEFNPDCVEFASFEPSSDFGSEPLMVCERVSDIPEDLKSDMANPMNGLIAIAVSRRDMSQGDIETPHKLGRLRYRLKCDSDECPFRIFNRDDYLIFRDRLKNRLRVRIHENKNTRGGRG